MTQRENILSLFRQKGFAFAPVEFSLCPSLEKAFFQHTGSSLSYQDYFEMPWRCIDDIAVPPMGFVPEEWFEGSLPQGTFFDPWGVARVPGSAAAHHMTRIQHPLHGCDDLARMRRYPFPRFDLGDGSHQAPAVAALHKRGLTAMGMMQCTLWETAWKMRGMEPLMMDMMDGETRAEFLLDAITEQAIARARSFAAAGVDLLYLGDDIGTQRGPLMSIATYQEWIWPRLQRVIAAAKAVKKDLIVLYHSCGEVSSFIPLFIEAGIDVLNPLQSECMDIFAIIREYRQDLSFHGGIGTQSTMPFGTPQEVRSKTLACLSACGKQGGMLVTPTHVLEPEVPFENILAYVSACREFAP